MNTEKNKEDIDKIISSFKELYDNNKKLSKFSMSDISEKSNILIGKLYSLFNCKEEIAIYIIEKSVNEIFLIFDEETSSDTQLGDQLKIFLSLQLEFLGPNINLINDFLLELANPFSDFSKFVNSKKIKYTNFLTEIITKNFGKKNVLFQLSIPLIVRTFMVFNIAVLKYWENDKSEGKMKTLGFIENGVKNFMVIATLM